MSNNFVRDPAGITTDPRRVENDGAVVSPGLGRLNRARWIRGVLGRGAVGSRWRYSAVVCTNGNRRSGLLINLLSCYLRPHEHAGVVLGDINLPAGVKAAITGCRFVVVLTIGEGIMLPRQQRKSRTDSSQENGAAL